MLCADCCVLVVVCCLCFEVVACCLCVVGVVCCFLIGDCCDLFVDCGVLLVCHPFFRVGRV